MEVHIPPELEARLDKLAAESGRPKDALIQDAMSAYLDDVAEVREMLESRYDGLKSGRGQPVDGAGAFAHLQQKSQNGRNRTSEIVPSKSDARPLNGSTIEMPSTCLAITGKMGAGKTTLSHALSRLLGLKSVTISTYIARLALERKKSVSREALQDLGLELVTKDPIGFCRGVLDFVGWNGKEGIIVDGLRNIMLFESLRSLVAPLPAVLVFITVDEDLRLYRLNQRGNREAIESLRHEQHSIEQRIALLEEQADIVVAGNASIMELANRVIEETRQITNKDCGPS